MTKRIQALIVLFSLAAVLAAAVAIGTTSARPIHCPLCCMDVPFPPYYVCWHCCP